MTNANKKASKKKKTTKRGRPKKTTTAAEKRAIKKAKDTLKKTKVQRPTKKTDRVGRPTILTPKLVDRLRKLILAGAFIETACAACGFNKKLYYEWLKLGHQRIVIKEQIDASKIKKKREELEKKLKMIDPIYEQFNDLITKAQAECEIRDLLRIDAAADKNWHASAWKLERKFPLRWARRQAIEHSGEIKQTETPMTEKRQALIEIMSDPKSLELAKQLTERMDHKNGKKTR
jgi:hypothetical protein